MTIIYAGDEHEFPTMYQAACWLVGRLNAEQLGRLRQQVQIELARRNLRVEPATEDMDIYPTEQTS